ncbi:MAG: cytochrome c [Anaerolineae bacterium]|nr:cytochrome c [Anaerolineae bacterium]
MRKLTLLLSLVLLISLAACGGNGDTSGTGTGDPAAGETVYNQTATPACNTCHSLEPGVALVGPSLSNIGAEAGQRVSGQSAEDYLREAVVDPNAFVVEGFGANIMPADYGSQLTEQQVTDLVAYLLSLQ